MNYDKEMKDLNKIYPDIELPKWMKEPKVHKEKLDF
jgi:hypothetical protein